MGGTKWTLVLLLALLVLPIVSAEVKTLSPVKQGSCVALPQTYANSSWQNISVIQVPDKTMIQVNDRMTNLGGGFFNYTFCNTGRVGEYIVNGVGDIDGVPQTWNYNFFVTPSGFTGILGLFVIVIAAIYFIAFFGFFGKSVWVAMFGGLGMILLGLFTLNNGIDIYRSFITEAFSFITIGIGSTFALTAGVDLIEENLM
jgi:hypothetical protein